MSSTVISSLIGVGTFILSMATSFFIAGFRWGETRGDIKTISERLAKIEGMFEMKLKE